MTRWPSPDGNIRRRIDYITINAEIQKYYKESTKQHLLARKYEPESATPSTGDEALLQRRQEI